LLSQGKLYVVGIGPGREDMLTLRALDVLRMSEVVLGHKTYTDRVRHLTDAEFIESGMGREVERVAKACELAKDRAVSLVSGGDPSIYGMSPLVAEYVMTNGLDIEVETIPGITAMSAASALLGSPINGDSVMISLSDHLTPWARIEERLRHALKGDFVITVYNPSSRSREGNLLRALDIVLDERGDLPVGIVRNAMREGEGIELITASGLKEEPGLVDMHTLLVIGNTETRVEGGRMFTPRGYSHKYDFMKGGRR